jgi:hypothetical protein
MTQIHEWLSLYWPVAIYSKLIEQDSWLSVISCWSTASCRQWGQETVSMEAVKGTSIPRSRYQATTNEEIVFSYRCSCLQSMQSSQSAVTICSYAQ